MLSTLRKNTKKIIWVLIFLFCSWGAFSVSVQFRDKGQIAGRVFGSAVSYQEFNKLRKATGIFTLTGEREKDPGILHQLTWQNLVFAREARRRWIKVSDEEVSDQVQKLLEVQKIPSTSPEVYERWVRSISGAAPREFEEMVREMIRIQKLLKEVRSEPVLGLTSEESKKMAAYATPETAAKYREDLMERNRIDHFQDWSVNLFKRAHFEDLMPEAAPPKSGTGPKANADQSPIST